MRVAPGHLRRWMVRLIAGALHTSGLPWTELMQWRDSPEVDAELRLPLLQRFGLGLPEQDDALDAFDDDVGGLRVMYETEKGREAGYIPRWNVSDGEQR